MMPIGAGRKERTMGVTRRRFLCTTVAGVTAAGVSGKALAMPVRRRRSVQEEVRVAVIGFNSRGRDHIEAFSKMSNVRVVALCDTDAGVLSREAKKLEGKGITVDAVADMRRIMDR